MPEEELAQAIRLVYKGYNQMGPGLLEKIIAKIPATDSDSSILLEKLSALTPRERDVLRTDRHRCYQSPTHLYCSRA